MPLSQSCSNCAPDNFSAQVFWRANSTRCEAIKEPVLKAREQGELQACAGLVGREYGLPCRGPPIFQNRYRMPGEAQLLSRFRMQSDPVSRFSV